MNYRDLVRSQEFIEFRLVSAEEINRFCDDYYAGKAIDARDFFGVFVVDSLVEGLENSEVVHLKNVFNNIWTCQASIWRIPESLIGAQYQNYLKKSAERSQSI